MVVAVKEWISNEIDFKTIPLPENIKEIVMFDESNWNIFFNDNLKENNNLYLLSNKNWDRVTEIYHKDMIASSEDFKKVLVLNDDDINKKVQILDLQTWKTQDIDYTIPDLYSFLSREISINKYWIISFGFEWNNSAQFFNLNWENLDRSIKEWFMKLYWLDQNDLWRIRYNWFWWFSIDLSYAEYSYWTDTQILLWLNISNINNIKDSVQLKTIWSYRMYWFNNSQLTIKWTIWWEKFNKTIRKVYDKNWKALFPIGEEGLEFVWHHWDRSKYNRNKMVIFDNNDKKLKVIKFDDNTIEILDSDFKKTIDNKNWRIFWIRKSSVKYFSPIEWNFVWFDPEQIKEGYTESALKYNILFDLEWNVIQNEKERKVYWEPFQFDWLWSRSDENKWEYSLFNSLWKEIINTSTDFGKKFIFYIRNSRLNYPTNFILGKTDDKKYLIGKNSVLDDAEIFDNNQLKIWDKNFLLKNFPWDGKTERKEIKNLWEDIEINWKKFKKRLTKFKI